MIMTWVGGQKRMLFSGEGLNSAAKQLVVGPACVPFSFRDAA